MFHVVKYHAAPVAFADRVTINVGDLLWMAREHEGNKVNLIRGIRDANAHAGVLAAKKLAEAVIPMLAALDEFGLEVAKRRHPGAAITRRNAEEERVTADA